MCCCCFRCGAFDIIGGRIRRWKVEGFMSFEGGRRRKLFFRGEGFCFLLILFLLVG
jgi:hypothetical protein